MAYAQTHDFAALVALTEIALGFEAHHFVVANESTTAVLEASLDGASVDAEIDPGGSWGMTRPQSSIWIRRKAETGDDGPHVAHVDADVENPPPPTPPPPIPPPDPDPVLEHVRATKIAAIDLNTRLLFARGFECPPGSGIRFSLSTQAQFNLEVMDRNRLDPLLAYPVVWNRRDDDGPALTIPDATTLHVFFLTALATGRANIDGGTALKTQARAAMTQAALDAVVDLRGVA